MSATAVDAPAAPAKSKKKLFLIAGLIVLLALAGGAGGAYFMLGGKKAHAKEESGGKAEADDSKESKEGKSDGHGSDSADKRDPHKKPTFVPFESFTINLNDQDQERYAQIIFAIETADAPTGETVKTQMPAIRGRVLMTLSSKSAKELMGRPGKEQLAKDILADARHVLGLSDKDKTLVDVHFSHFVIQ